MSHSPAFATGLTADSVDLTRTDLRVLARITTGIYGGLDYRGDDVIVPTSSGRVPQSRVADVRTIIAEGDLMGVGEDEAEQRADLAATLRELDALMRSDQSPYTLEATLLDGTVATITARPTGFDPIEGPVPSFMTARFEWISVDPDWEFAEPVS